MTLRYSRRHHPPARRPIRVEETPQEIPLSARAVLMSRARPARAALVMLKADHPKLPGKLYTIACGHLDPSSLRENDRQILAERQFLEASADGTYRLGGGLAEILLALLIPDLQEPDCIRIAELPQ